VSDSTVVQFPDTLGLFIPTVQSSCGATVDVPVKAYRVKQLLTMQGSINWIASDLRYEGIANLGPVSMGLTMSNFGVSQIGSGILTFSWDDPKLTGVTLPDTATLFVIRFTALGSLSRSIPVSISGTPTALEFYDTYFRKKPAVVRHGSVNLTCLATISGRIISPLDEAVAGVELVLTGTENRKVVTDKSGNFLFQLKPGNYVLTPGKNNEKTKTNGISTMDLALIQSHVLNNQYLNSPYKVIAADVDGSGSVATIDLVHIRRMLLGKDTAMPGNRTWVFVDSTQVFANSMSPFPYNKSRSFTNLSGAVSQTFRAIKLGDVNWDRNPQVEQSLGMDTMKVYYEVGEAVDGMVSVKLRARNVRSVLGFQYTLQWKREQLEFLGIGENPLGISFGDGWASDGYLALSWNDPEAKGKSLHEGDLLFELRFGVRGQLDQQVLQAGSWKVSTEVFDKDYLKQHLVMEARSVIPGDPIFDDRLKVYPNPATNLVNIQWSAATAGKGLIRVLDGNGRKVLEQQVIVAKGANKYQLNLDSRFVRQGIYIVQLETGGEVRTERIVVIR
jgi:hypothetical protein